MKIDQIGEFSLIDLIQRKILSKDKRVIVNIGDDAAVIKSSPVRFCVFTTDTLIEKIHFDLKYFSYEEIGWKAMVANLSDIAAMGGLPTYALVTIGLTKSMRVEDVLSVYEGASRIAQRYDCKIIGGDTTLVPRDIFISIALLGEVERKNLVTRSGAKKGDLICVTGKLGEAHAGLQYLKKYGRGKPSLTRKHLKPDPRIKEARYLVKNLKINSMIDISDGLSSELFHLTERSQLGALIYEENIPISSRCLRLAPVFNENPLIWALSSGEEYELLFTVAGKDRGRIEKIKSKVDVTIIGEMVDKSRGVKLVQKAGKLKDLNIRGFVHF